MEKRVTVKTNFFIFFFIFISFVEVVWKQQKVFRGKNMETMQGSEISQLTKSYTNFFVFFFFSFVPEAASKKQKGIKKKNMETKVITQIRKSYDENSSFFFFFLSLYFLRSTSQYFVVAMPQFPNFSFSSTRNNKIAPKRKKQPGSTANV